MEESSAARFWKGMRWDASSQVSEDGAYEVPLEVTHEDHVRRVRLGSSSSQSSRRRASRRQPRSVLRDAQSVASDNATAHSVDSKSISYTVASYDTVKASNTSGKGVKKLGGWSKLKRMIGVKTAPVDGTKVIKQSHSYTYYPPAHVANKSSPLSVDSNRKRINSRESKPKRVRSSPQEALKSLVEQEIVDDCIRGRLDGIDVICLGGAQLFTRKGHPYNPSTRTLDDFPKHSFVGESFELSPADMISNMLWTCGGRNPPEMILDGFVPGGDDRWTVLIERPGVFRRQTSRSLSKTGRTHSPLPSLQPVDTDENELDDGGSPVEGLWNSLWGSDPAPVNMTDLNRFDANDDPVLLLAADCSVPIDVDEDTFIISTREHLRAIHDIASGPLSSGDFDLALAIFFKLLKGLDFAKQGELVHLRGTTLHNIGVIQLWQGKYEEALISFRKAVDERARYLPKNHPDTVVSLTRKGIALFALERFDQAVAAFEIALTLMPRDHRVKAKVQNNLGAAYFQLKDYTAALKQFSASLEIQQTWLGSSVHREALVYDASVTLSNMGRVYMERSDSNLACNVYEEALLLRTAMFKKDTDIVLEAMTSLAIAKAIAGKTKNALEILQSCVRLKNERFGSGNVSAIEAIGLMGYLYTKLPSTEEAAKCLSAVKNWQKVHLSPRHPSCLQTKVMVDALEKAIVKRISV